ncbi:patatin-like phospholipase family protein [Spongiibacter sp. KMU-158]|uniref:Patatin-like phospholipase family protein n=2 Tax=Spongiibacter pelagi TaxID=2760804 RepID=A0A927GVX1_9GAMM|nr:patatin-like phospholipase family protein [Spongiibacter pelagi]
MAHIGVIQQLNSMGIRPDILCGTSAGAVVAACQALGKLDQFAEWIQTLNSPSILRYLSINFGAIGGMADASRLIDFFCREFGNPDIEDLDTPFAAVATDLGRGREVWLQSGPIWDAVRASIALPGILTPVFHNGNWLIDGGLVNPVPVSVCRALGADIVIGIDLNSDLLSKQTRPASPTPISEKAEQVAEEEESEEENDSGFGNALNRFGQSVMDLAGGLRSNDIPEHKPAPNAPNTMNVIMSSINIMQDRITRSRLAGEPADVMLWPRLREIGLMEFNRAEEAIAGGREAVERMRPAILHILAEEGITPVSPSSKPQHIEHIEPAPITDDN